MTDAPTLAQLVRTARKTRGWSMESLAWKAGVSLATLQRIETGKVRNPHLDTVKALEAKLHVALSRKNP